MDSDVCSVQLHVPTETRLKMSATYGFNRNLVGEVELDLDAGLAEHSLRNLRLILVDKEAGSPFYTPTSWSQRGRIQKSAISSSGAWHHPCSRNGHSTKNR